MQNIQYKKDGNIAILTISRPKQLNALNRETLEELIAVLKENEQDSELGCLILTGEGDKAFVAGADISEMADMDESQARSYAELGLEVMGLVESMHCPVIAAVNGYALGGGCELALSCDIILAAENAVFALPEVTLGIIPGWGGTQKLVRRIGPGKAKHMIFTGTRVKAAEAVQTGLAEKACEAGKLMDDARELAVKIASLPKGAIASAKAAADAGSKNGTIAGQETETRLFSERFATSEQKDGMKRFLEGMKK